MGAWVVDSTSRLPGKFCSQLSKFPYNIIPTGYNPLARMSPYGSFAWFLQPLDNCKHATNFAWPSSRTDPLYPRSGQRLGRPLLAYPHQSRFRLGLANSCSHHCPQGPCPQRWVLFRSSAARYRLLHAASKGQYRIRSYPTPCLRGGCQIPQTHLVWSAGHRFAVYLFSCRRPILTPVRAPGHRRRAPKHQTRALLPLAPRQSILLLSPKSRSMHHFPTFESQHPTISWYPPIV